MNTDTFREIVTTQKVVWLLGAGASRDYGFPLWSDLKAEMLSQLTTNPEFIKDYGETACKDWQNKLEVNSQKTVDEIAADMNEDGYRLFRALVGKIIFDHEKRDLESPSQGWIEELLQKFKTLFITLEAEGCKDDFVFMMQNTHFVTLNYDRCFEHHFCNALSTFLKTEFNERRFYSKHIGNLFQPPILNVTHPHGAIGTMGATVGDSNRIKTYLGASEGLEYGKARRYGANEPPAIIAVDDVLDTLNPAMDKANALIHDSMVICFGLSELGFSQSAFRWQNAKNIRWNCTPASGSKIVETVGESKLTTPSITQYGKMFLNFLFPR